MKGLIIALLAIAIGGGAYYAYTNSTPEEEEKTPEEEAVENGTTSGMRAEENAVVTVEQRPGSSVTVSQVYLASPGYVVIHADNNGKPGDILGASVLLPSGESQNVQVTLSRKTADGEKLWSMLHSERNGNSTFEVAADTPVQSRLGGPLSGWFEVHADAPEDIPVTL